MRAPRRCDRHDRAVGYFLVPPDLQTFASRTVLPDAAEWRIPGSGPLSGANGAMPWIILQRDRARFEAQFPQWRIRRIQPFMPLRYLLSGGVSLRSLMPGWTFPLWRALEAPLAAKAGMVAVIVLEKM